MAKAFKTNIIGSVEIQASNPDHAQRTWEKILEMLRYRYPNMKVSLSETFWTEEIDADSSK